MPTVRISPLPDGGLGSLGGPFAIESADAVRHAPDQQSTDQQAPDRQAAQPDDDVVATIVQFGRWVSRGMSYYQNKGGIEDSSLFKSFAVECFEELSRDDPEAAAHLTNLTVICSGLPAAVAGDPVWRLHRAILAMLPGIHFVE